MSHLVCTPWTTKCHPSASCYDANPLFPRETEPVGTAGTLACSRSSQEPMRSTERGSTLSKIWKSLLYSQPRDTPAPPHLAPSRKSSCEANGANRKLHKRCSFESKWSLSSTFKAEVKLSLQKKAVTEQVTLPPLTVWHWPRRIWLSWQDHSKCSFSSPLPRWPAAPQLPWEAG